MLWADLPGVVLGVPTHFERIPSIPCVAWGVAFYNVFVLDDRCRSWWSPGAVVRCGVYIAIVSYCHCVAM